MNPTQTLIEELKARTMGERPPGLQLERKDNNGNYEPSNCRWATKKEQCRNTRNSKWITFGGVTQTAAAWAEQTGISRSTIQSRIGLGWSDEKIITTPKQYQQRKPNHAYPS